MAWVGGKGCGADWGEGMWRGLSGCSGAGWSEGVDLEEGGFFFILPAYDPICRFVAVGAVTGICLQRLH